jgi:hypothetical protein
MPESKVALTMNLTKRNKKNGRTKLDVGTLCLVLDWALGRAGNYMWVRIMFRNTLK